MYPSVHSPPNVIILGGFPWYVSEAVVSVLLSELEPVRTVRSYDDYHNGSSRGIFFVECNPSALMEYGRKRVFSLGPYAEIKATTLHMTSQRWDRSGALPELPGENHATCEAFGREGFKVRAICLRCPSTATVDGEFNVAVLRKRLREEH